MVMKLLYLLVVFLLAGVAMGQTSDFVFFSRNNISSAAVAENVRQIGRVNAAGQIPTYELGRIVTIPKLQGCRQITVIVRTPVNTYYHPIPTRKDCFGSCPPGQICTAFKTVIRSMKVVCYKRFNCWGKFIWIPIGVRTLCIRDEFNCKCKRRCKPLWCIPPRKFNKSTCDCECPKIRCRPPFTLDPSSCQCRCPKNIVCRRPKILNFKTCKCVCLNKCRPPFIQDSKCRCICRKRCPRHSYLDRRKCQCVGDCKQFRTASDCNKIDSCSDNRARKCRYFSSSRNPCQCECCVKKNPRSRFDCGRFTPRGKRGCQLYTVPRTSTKPCKWACT